MDAERKLGVLLERAYSGELGAAMAYEGHARALRGVERREVEAIRIDELHHRARVGEMLTALGRAPNPSFERRFFRIGAFIRWFCGVSGWYVPMWGAGRLERGNVAEYEVAARFAWLAHKLDWVEELLVYAEVEWDHEAYFRRKCEAHWMKRLLPVWRPLPPRAEIRTTFAAFVEAREAPQSASRPDLGAGVRRLAPAPTPTPLAAAPRPVVSATP